jgi:hypothetical protein
MLYMLDLLDVSGAAYDLQVGFFHDAEAKRAAEKLMDRRDHAAAIDVWRLNQCIARIPAPGGRLGGREAA